jgi:hypothetical protein
VLPKAAGRWADTAALPFGLVRELADSVRMFREPQRKNIQFLSSDVELRLFIR